MKLNLALMAAWLLSGAASAGDVYVSTDAQGRKIYTDTPQSVPAQKLDIHSQSTDPAATAKQYSSEMNRYGQQEKASSKAQAQQAAAEQTAQATAEERAKRCTNARQQYQVLMNNWRIYEQGPNGERTYLSADQIDKERASAKQFMDQACADQ
jgi:hypothetical protein